MASVRVNIADFSMASEWRCIQEGSTYRIVYGPTTPTKTITIKYALPKGAIINNATLYGTLGSPFTGIAFVRINGISFRSGSADLTDYATETELVAQFEFKAYGYVMNDTKIHYGTLPFTNMYLLVEYTPAEFEWRTNIEKVTAGTPVTFSIISDNETFVHKISIRLSSEYQYSAYVDAGVKTHTVTVPIDWANGMPDSMYADAMVTVEALTGDTLELVGQPKVGTLQILCPEYELEPGTLVLTVNQPMWGLCVQDYSTVTATHSGGSSYYGGEITGVYISGGGYSSPIRTLVTGVMKTAGECTFKAAVMDSRGHLVYATATVNVVAYTPPMIQGAMQTRADGAGEVSNQGANVQAAVFYTYAAIGENQIEVDMKYRVYGSSEWIDGCSGAFGSGEFVHFGNNQIATNQSYEIQITVRDALSSASIIRTIGPSSAYMVWDAKNNAIGFGCRPSGFNRVQLSSEWELYLGVKTVFDHMHPIGSVCFLVSGTSLDDATYGEWVQIGSITIGDTAINAWKRTM